MLGKIMLRRKFYDAKRLKDMAEEVSAWPLTVQGTEEKHQPTEEEKRIVYNIVYSALISFNSYCGDGGFGGNSAEKTQAVCDNAELTFDLFTGWKYNGYVSLYMKLKKILSDWEMEEY